MASGCLVLVDGWNHFLQTQSCFGYEVAVKFPLDRLASHAAALVGEDAVTDVAVVMAIPDRNRPGEEPEYWAWRKKLNKLGNYGVRHERAKFAYHDMFCVGCGCLLDRIVTCPHCARENPLPGRRKEKGADVKLAMLALDAAWRQDHSSLIIFAQDSDYGPLARQVRTVYEQQGRHCKVYSAFPKCGDSAHDHRGVPGTQWLPIDEENYAKLIALPFANPRG